MQGNKESQELSVLGRLISMEALLFLMGVVSLVFGLLAGQLWNIVFGALIVLAAVFLARKWRRGTS
jgi:uncharacterized membrane protein